MERSEENGEVIQKGVICEACGGDNAVLYADGHVHCFSPSCGVTKFQASPGTPSRPVKQASMELRTVAERGAHKAIASRKITQETCSFWDYRVSVNSHGEKEHLAPYHDAHGQLVGIKIRNLGEDGTAKDFQWVGAAHGNLYGRHHWGSGGRMVVVCEGEIDTLTVSQWNDHKYPVVGVPDGAPSAAKAVAKNLEWLNTFDKVIFALDMDQPGRDACRECAELIAPGKAYIVSWPDGAKDPNELHLRGLQSQGTAAIWNAKSYRPDGIIDARDLTAACLSAPTWGIPWPHASMTEWTYGRRHGELYTFGAGTSIGKTDLMSEVIASTVSGTTKYGETYIPEGCALFGYEAGAAKSKKYIAGKLAARRFHIPHPKDGVDNGADWTTEELVGAMGLMDNDLWERGGRLFINDSKGATDWDAVVSRSRFLAHSEGIKHIFIDPLSALVAESAGEQNQVQFIDKLIRQAANLAIELDVCFYLYSHLTRPKEGPGHEDGGQTHINQFRGSNAIGMFSDFVFGQERNTQAENKADRSITTVRVLKDRLTGNFSGETTQIFYDVLNGTMEEMSTQNDLVGAMGGDTTDLATELGT